MSSPTGPENRIGTPGFGTIEPADLDSEGAYKGFLREEGVVPGSAAESHMLAGFREARARAADRPPVQTVSASAPTPIEEVRELDSGLGQPGLRPLEIRIRDTSIGGTPSG